MSRRGVTVRFAGAAVCLFLAVILLEFSGAGMVSVRTPLDGYKYVLVSILFLACAYLFVSALARLQGEPRGLLSVDGGTVLAGSGSSALQRLGSRTSASIIATWVFLALSLMFTLLLVTDPLTFTGMAQEGGFIETASAAMSFLSFFILIIASVRIWRTGNPARVRYLIPAVLLVLYFFVMGMEEVSWFQRVLGYETPALLAGNSQGEINLHNYDTLQSFNAYFITAFMFLLLFPFLRDLTGILRSSRVARLFTPNVYIVMMGAIAGAFNYKLWGFASVQLSFFASIFILMFYARRAERNRSLVIAVMLGCLAIQAMIALSGSGLEGSQATGDFRDVSEYREFLTPLAFLFYSLEVLSRTRRRDLRPARP
ncbi:MAG: hypothetical protein C4534_10735 [Gaiellales bacterium]|nr:MAG: hypothetical protein C4534_10735 [Gaiellales bacterium]